MVPLLPAKVKLSRDEVHSQQIVLLVQFAEFDASLLEVGLGLFVMPSALTVAANPIALLMLLQQV
jgi:Tfp pilus assembly protein PilN